jgi:DNA gyrase subunit A
MDVARDDQEVLVVTENGFGKRTPVSEYRKTSRGAKGVQTIKFSEKRGGLAAALVVRPHQELLFISQEGMVQRTGVRGIRQTGRAAQGVTLMNVRDDDRVSAVALVVESEAPTAATVAERLTPIDGDPVDALAAAGRAETNGDAGEAPELDGRRRRRVADRRRLSERGLSRRCGLIISDHQRKEVVRISSSSSCGTLEVTGR